MTDITNIVNLNITRRTQIPTLTGLSTIALISTEAATVFDADVNIKTYSTVNLLTQLTEDGFATTSEVYKARYQTPVSYTHLTLPTNREV